jgi:selenocysteine-specific elongation factor
VEVIVGTAGHIDHGKTALVEALTGVDADRLPEEKRRGITIDIGFAEMSVGDTHFGFVDVPGHERFVKNMLAGASGIDIVMLVIAADEGVMPQTREHFDICRLLGTTAGLIALTKTDLVDADRLDLTRLDAAELVAGSFLENAPIVHVSSKTGAGVDELRDALFARARVLAKNPDDRVTRLPIDRSFSMKGFGAVVTGTLASGEIKEVDELELLPGRRIVRVRGLQTHGRSVRTVAAGQRAAVNLSGIEHGGIVRGMLLVEPNVLHSTPIFDAEVEVLPGAPRPLRSRQRVRLHVGTAEVLARLQVLNESGEIAPGAKDFVQLRLEAAVAVVPGERFIIRSYSPQTTIAGGVVIDNSALRHRRKDLNAVRAFLGNLLAAGHDHAASIRLLIEHTGASGKTFAELQSQTGLRNPVLAEAVKSNIAANTTVDLGGRYVAASAFDGLLTVVETELAAFHKKEPLATGISREQLRERVFSFLPAEIANGVLSAAAAAGTVALDKEMVRLASHQTQLSPSETKLNEKIRSIYESAKLEVPRLDDALADAVGGTSFTQSDARKYLQRFIESGEIVKVTDEFYFSRDVINALKQNLEGYAATTADRLIDVPKFKELADISRKYAIPLLEYLDREHVTARAGDKRIIL